MMEQRYDLSPSRSSSKRISFGERALPSQEQLDEMIMLIDAHVAQQEKEWEVGLFRRAPTKRPQYGAGVR
jgi:hypothetical protein